MIIRPLADADSPAFEQLAREHGSVFQSVAWTSLFGNRLTRYGVFQNDGSLVGGFCLNVTTRMGLKMLRDSPFTPNCGPFFKIEARNPVAQLESRREMLTAIASFLDQKTHVLVSLCLDPRTQDALPFAWRNFKVVPRYTYILNLSASPEDLKRNMSSVRRNDISKAARDGLVVRKCTDPNVVRGLVSDSLARQQVHINQSDLDAILLRFANETNSFAFCTFQGDSAIACCFIVHDSRTAHYILGGTRTGEKHHGAGALALSTAIAHAKAIGLAEFDFEGSMIPEIERYFRGFGGHLTPYYTLNKAWFPVEMALKFAKRSCF